MNQREATRLSKFLSLVLRHRPDEYGLHMDDEGFVDFESLIDVIVAEDISADTAEDDVREIVEGSDRARFEIADGKIRALYGHSSRVSLKYPEHDAPARLYHGGPVSGARKIGERGIQPAGRALVHLSSTADEALAVGRRNDPSPVVVEVDTAVAGEHGVTFYQATEKIWLCPEIPADACIVPELPEAPARSSAPLATGPIGRVDGATGGGGGGLQRVEPPAEGGFKRRTKKKATGRR